MLTVTTLKVTEKQKAELERLSRARDRSTSWLMRQALDQFLEREARQEGFREAALQSWTAYQETGQHLTGQEVADWLESWGSEKSTAAPQTHK